MPLHLFEDIVGLNLLPEVILHRNVGHKGVAQQLLYWRVNCHLALLFLVGLSLLQLRQICDLNVVDFLLWVVQWLIWCQVDLCYLIHLWLCPSEPLNLLLQILNLCHLPLAPYLCFLLLELHLGFNLKCILLLNYFVLHALVLYWFRFACVLDGIHSFFVRTHELINARYHDSLCASTQWIFQKPCQFWVTIWDEFLDAFLSKISWWELAASLVAFGSRSRGKSPELYALGSLLALVRQDVYALA